MKKSLKQIFILAIIFLLIIMPFALAGSMNVALRIKGNTTPEVKEKVNPNLFLGSVWNKVTGNAIVLEEKSQDNPRKSVFERVGNFLENYLGEKTPNQL
jgi:hypothetical protein